MKNDIHIAWRLIGRGSEASVYHDEEHNHIVKQYDRTPLEIARKKASREFHQLEMAASRTRNSSHISVPRPIGISEDGKALLMDYVAGESLLWHLTHTRYSPAEIQHFVDLVGEGLSLLNSSEGVLQPDCTLDHIIVNDAENITFIDFGNGSENLEGISNTSLAELFAELVGSSLYECSRPTLQISATFFAQIGLFVGLLAQHLGLEWNQETRRKSWEKAAMRMSGGAFMRTMYYWFKGQRVAKKIFHFVAFAAPSSRESDSFGKHSTNTKAENQLDHLFFVVADFPVDFEVLSNGIHKAVHGLVKGISSSPQSPPLHILAVGSPATVPTDHGYTIRYFRSHWSMVRFIKSKGKNTFSILNSIFSIKNTVTGILLCMSRQPYVVAPHLELSDRLFAKNKWPKLIYWHLFERWSLGCASGIHMLDIRQCERLKELGIQTPSFASPNGILDSILDASPAINWTSEGPVRFHFFGRIETQTKGLDMLITAVSKVSADHTIEVFIQGPDCGDLSSLQSDVAQRGLEPFVHFLDADYRSNPIDIMSQYDVFILPSRFEGFPVAAVEAMVSARAIVMTDVGGLAPILKKHNLGIVVEPSTEGIEDGIRQAIASRPNWKVDGMKARAYAVNHFRWSAIGNDVLKEIQHLRTDD